VFSLNSNYFRVPVTHHGPTKPSPEPAQPGSGDDFCRQYVAAAQWSHDHQPPPPEPRAAELVKRFTAMRPSAPAAYADDLDTMIAIYSMIVAGANFGVVAAEMMDRDFPGAGTRLAKYCRVDPALLAVEG
jgi:hypothetical protein